MAKRFLALVGLLAASFSAAEDLCEARPDASRIAVAGGSITEILYFLGAEAQIVGVDTTSTFPSAAREFPSIGYVRNLSAEGLLSISPKLVLGEEDMGPPNVVAQIAKTGMPIISIPEVRSAIGILDKVRCVAAILGLSQRADALIAEQLISLVDELATPRLHAQPSPRIALLLDTNGGSLVAAGQDTAGNGIIEMAGARNMFSNFSGWKPVSVEAILNGAPEFVVVSTMSSRGDASTPPHLRASPLGDRLIAMDAMVLLGFGPRTLGAALQLARTFRGLEVQNAANRE